MRKVGTYKTLRKITKSIGFMVVCTRLITYESNDLVLPVSFPKN